jgi:hypothetical protein
MKHMMSKQAPICRRIGSARALDTNALMRATIPIDMGLARFTDARVKVFGCRAGMDCLHSLI